MTAHMALRIITVFAPFIGMIALIPVGTTLMASQAPMLSIVPTALILVLGTISIMMASEIYRSGLWE